MDILIVFSNIDVGSGLIKTDWSSVRSRAHKIEPEFSSIVDGISPGQDFPLYLAYFPYGAKKGDKDNYLHGCDNKVYSLKYDKLPTEVRNDLGYGASSTPMGMVMDKIFEYFIPPVDGTKNTYPWRILGPGSIFPIGRLFRSKNNYSYTPNNLLSVTAGARSTFLLQQISSLDFHSGLESIARCSLPFPDGYSTHWEIFSLLANLKHNPSPWRACLMYFSEKWITHLYEDPAWLPLKTYLINLFWHRSEYDRAAKFYASAFSLLKRSKNIRSDRYVEQTVRHLFSIALGEEVGFSPATTDHELPLTHLKSFFSSHYRLKGKSPTFMIPQHFSYQTDGAMPIYYSMQHPTLRDFTSQNRKVITAAEELKKMKILLTNFNQYILGNDMFEGTIYHEIAKTVDFSFYHNLKSSCNNGVNETSILLSLDKRFSTDFTSSSKFMRGCIAISRKSAVTQAAISEFCF